MPEGTEHLLINPTTEAVIAPFNGAPRLPTLAGTRLGIIDDSKKNADVLLGELVEILQTRYEISDVKWHRKPTASKPADPAVIREMAETCDCVVVAVGD